MNLYSQLVLGNLGSTFYGIWGTLVFAAPVPLFIWFVVSVILWFRQKKRRSLIWWGIVVGICCLYGVFTVGYWKLFDQAPYMIAQRINVYVPMSVQVLESDQGSGRDAQTEYEVIRFNPSQMVDFVRNIKANGWRYGTVVPDALRHANPNDYPNAMSGRKYPLPKAQRKGYYYSFITKRYGTGDWYTTRKAYFLDIQTRTLYVYFDDSQWG